MADNTFEIGVDAVQRIAEHSGQVANLAELDPDGFVDRSGAFHMSFIGAKRLARAFAAANPETVTLYLEVEERGLLANGWGEGPRYYHDQLLECGPPFALIRQWAGFEAEISLLRDEIKRLQNITRNAVYELRTAGADLAAIKIERSLRGE